MTEAATNQGSPTSRDIGMALAQVFKENNLIVAPAEKTQPAPTQFEQLYSQLASNPDTDKGQLELLKQCLDTRDADRSAQAQKEMDGKIATIVQKMGIQQAENSVRAEVHRLVEGDEDLAKFEEEIVQKAFKDFNESKDYEQARYQVSSAVVDSAMVKSLVKGAIKHYGDKLNKAEDKGLAGMKDGVASSQASKVQKGDDTPGSVDELNSRQREWYYERVDHNVMSGQFKTRADAEAAAMKSTLSIGLLKKAM